MRLSPALFIIAAVVLACTKTEKLRKDLPSEPATYRERHRPQLHFSPKEKWTNDPNGLFYLDGEYHLFYQYYPDSTVWGPMHWGHAVSRDLVRWEHLPIALYPDSLGYIFSGSAIVDTANTSGFGSKQNPPVVAIYTYHDPAGDRSGRNDFQTQGIAYSLDKGRSWKKYSENPVLKNPGIRDFRDPKVAWSEAAGQWVMTLAVKDHIEFYGSPDLKNWSKLSEFGKNEGNHGGVWECPDLLRMRDDKGRDKYVLLVSINPGAPNGGSGTQFFVGTFDGKKFVNELPGQEAGWIDYGTDNYAGVTFSNMPRGDDRPVLIGWMNNWLYADKVPTDPWRGAMTVPRKLTLATTEQGFALCSMPIAALSELAYKQTRIASRAGADTVVLLGGDDADSSGIPLQLDGRIAKGDFILELRNKQGQKLVAGFDEGNNTFYVDRSASTAYDFHPQFRKRITAPRLSTSDSINVAAVVDVASIELFFDDGRTVLTAIAFPDEPFQEIVLFSPSGKIGTGAFKRQHFRSIWE